jgi:hypothetical protein
MYSGDTRGLRKISGNNAAPSNGAGSVTLGASYNNSIQSDCWLQRSSQPISWFTRTIISFSPLIYSVFISFIKFFYLVSKLVVTFRPASPLLTPPLQHSFSLLIVSVLALTRIHAGRKGAAGDTTGQHVCRGDGPGHVALPPCPPRPGRPGPASWPFPPSPLLCFALPP